MPRIDLLNLIPKMLLNDIKDDEFNMLIWTGCAAGWAIKKLPEIAATGLRVSDYGEMIFGDVKDNIRNFDALAKAFNISTEDSWNLFSTKHYAEERPTRQQVANHIENWLKEKNVS